MMKIGTTNAYVDKYTGRKQNHGDEKVPAHSLGIEVSAPIDSLKDLFDESFDAYKAALFKDDGSPRASHIGLNFDLKLTDYLVKIGDVSLPNSRIEKVKMSPGLAGNVRLTFKVNAETQSDDAGPLLDAYQTWVEFSAEPTQNELPL